MLTSPLDRHSMVTAPRTLQSVRAFRGAAALLVLFFHASSVSTFFLHSDFWSWLFFFGYSGVDFFFVLSGFIIFLTHRADIGRSERLNAYLTKRFIRIYPVYWTVALVLVPVYFGTPRH